MRPDSPQDFNIPDINREFLDRRPRVGDQRVEVQSLSQGKRPRRGEAKLSIGLRLKSRQVKWVGGLLLNVTRFYASDFKKNVSTLVAEHFGLRLRNNLVPFVL